MTKERLKELFNIEGAEIAAELAGVSFWPNKTGAEVMEEITEESTEIPDNLKYYIDYEAMARDEILSGYMIEVSNGVLLI